MKRQPFISKSCSFYLRYDNYQEALVYQSLSGLGQNKLGRYLQCLTDDKNQYFLIQAHRKNYQLISNVSYYSKYINQQQISLSKYLSQNFTIGFCFNKVCSSEDLSYGLESTSKYVFLPYQIDKVISPAQIIPQYDVWTIVTLIFLVFLILSCLTSTILKYYFKKRKYKQQHIFIECFSLQNTIRLLSYKRNNLYDQIRVFSGIKFLSFIGIILSHMLILLLKAPSTIFKKDIKVQYFYSLFYSIDVWLAISGFFLSYIALKQFEEFKSIKIHLLRIARRFLRFWPLYILMVMFTWKIAPFLGDGPLWGYAIKYFQTECGASFFNYLFLIQNFTPNSCNSWLWLWQTDIQLCIFFTPLLLLYCKLKGKIWKLIFFMIQLILLGFSLIIPSYIQSANNIHQFYSLIQLQSINISPISRVGGYMVGYNLGILFFEFRRSKQIQRNKIYRLMMKRITRVFIILFAFSILSIMAYYISMIEKQELTYDDKLILNTFHFLFPLTVCLLISPPLFGFTSWFKDFLQFSKFSLLSKLSMSAYAVHYIIQIATIYSRKTDLYLNYHQIILSALYSILPIFAISICFTALIEMPLYVAKKIYLKTPRITYFEH